MIRKTLIFCLLLAILGPLLLLTQTLDSQPLILQAKTPDAQDAQKTKALIKRTLRLLEQENRATLSATEADLNAAVAFLARGSSRLAGQFRMTQQGLDGIFSFRLPKTPFGEYINLFLSVLPSEHGLVIDHIELGDVKIPGSLALQLLQTGGDFLLGEQLGRQTLRTIEQVSFSSQQMSISFTSGTRLAALKEQLSRRLKAFREDYAQVGELEKIRYYHAQLIAMGQLNLGSQNISLNRFMAPLFQLAEIRSQKASPTAENQAALYALAIYLGSRQFQKFTGQMDEVDTPAPKTRTGNIVLGDRKDLRQHFLVSAGLKLLTDSEMGFAVGEFKELLDSNRGGSGFSFIDLAADRAGLAFAERATSSPESAREFQRIMAHNSDEKSYFTDFSDLEEGLDLQQFVEQYGNIDSVRYAEIVQLIDQRLSTLPLYR